MRNFFWAALLLSSGLARANTITVTSTGDTVALDGVVTLREAVTAANTNAASGDAPAGSPGSDTIQFAIPGGGVHTIALTQALVLSESAVLDGYSQLGAKANTLANGDNAVLLIELDGSAVSGGLGALVVRGGNSTVRGLVVNRTQNAGQGIYIDSVGNNLLTGNFIGCDPGGTIAHGNGIGIRIVGVGNNVIGGASPAERNLISGNSNAGGDGIDIQNAGADGNQVLGNYIGTDLTGTVALPNTSSGVLVNAGASHTTVANNLISGNGGVGVWVTGGANTGVQGNLIGVDVNGNPLGNFASGVQESGNNNVVGGETPGAANVIANNGKSIGLAGVLVQPSSSAPIIEANSIYGNGAGISIVTGTEEAAPVLTAATSSAVGGTAHGAPAVSLLIELFGNPTCDGEGKTFLGSTSVVTNGTGDANFTFDLAVAGVLTATATSVAVGTSPFSACRTVALPDMSLLNDLSPLHDMALLNDLSPIPDMAPDIPPDLSSRISDLSSPEIAPDMPREIAPDMPREIAPDMSREITPDMSPDMPLISDMEAPNRVPISNAAGCSCEMSGTARPSLLMVWFVLILIRHTLLRGRRRRGFVDPRE